jgi:NAD(P)-dependent dehydrogenase (short-subunit alcohol dehydrogenase family)
MKRRMHQRFDGKVVIVTGAATGMGATTAEMFAAEGAAVVVADLAEAAARETVARIERDDGRAIYVPTNVTRAADCQRCVETAVSEFGRLDCLFNNAGLIRFGTAETLPEEDWDLMLSVILKGAFLMTKYAVPAMRKAGGGAIVNSGSNCSHIGCVNFCGYSAAKAAMPVLTKSMALDFWCDRIRVNCVSPGFVQTPMGSAVLEQIHGRPPTPEEIADKQRPEAIAEAVLFLCAEEQSFDITGITLPVSRTTFAGSSG